MAKSLKKIKLEKEQNDIERVNLKNQIKSLENKLKKIPILCNKCGKSCIAKGSHDENYGMINAKVYGGYYSPALNDETQYSFSLCEPCLKELFDSFVINAEE